MGSGTKEFEEEAQGLYQGSSLTAGPGLGERQRGPFSSWRGAGWEGVPAPTISQFRGVLKFLHLSLPPLCLTIKPLPDAEHHLLLKRSLTDATPLSPVPHLKRDKGVMPPVGGTGGTVGNVQCLAPRSPITGHYFLNIIY